MTWEIDYKLAVLRAAGFTVKEIMQIDLSTVNVQVTASDGTNIGGNCDTCGYGSSSPSISIDVYSMLDGKNQIRYFYGPEDVADFFRRVLSP